MIAIFLVYGLYFGLTEGVEKAWVADLAPAGARGTAFGVYNAALGVGGLAASLMFGVDLDARLAAARRSSPAPRWLSSRPGCYTCLFPHEENSRHQR